MFPTQSRLSKSDTAISIRDAEPSVNLLGHDSESPPPAVVTPPSVTNPVDGELLAMPGSDPSEEHLIESQPFHRSEPIRVIDRGGAIGDHRVVHRNQPRTKAA